ncbi:MAG: hypothetical protein PHV82_08220 [Victivallaceae bacterium]|nr:hypothetical protein [Victivallaceae bacterium]
MDNELKIAVIGLDTSHAVEFPRRMQASDFPAENKISGMRAIACHPFLQRGRTGYQTKATGSVERKSKP